MRKEREKERERRQRGDLRKYEVLSTETMSRLRAEVPWAIRKFAKRCVYRNRKMVPFFSRLLSSLLTLSTGDIAAQQSTDLFRSH